MPADEMDLAAPLSEIRRPKLLSSPMVLAAGWLMVGAFAIGLALMDDYRARVRLFQILWLLGFAGFAVLVVCAKHATQKRVSGWWLVGFVALRLILIATPPSDDLHRYMWEAKVQRFGVNPYSVSPDSPELAELRRDDPNWQHINHKDYPAIYPPLAQMSFRVMSLLGDSVYIAKVVFLLLDIVVVLLLWRWLIESHVSPALAVVYAANPLVLVAFAADGHLDPLMLVWIAAGLLFAGRQRFYLLGCCVGLAISSKLVAVVLLPWLFVRHWRAGWVAIVVLAATYLPYLGAGADLFRSLTRFTAETSVLGLVHGPLEWMIGGVWSRRLCAILLTVILAVLSARRLKLDAYACYAFASLVLLVPVLHFWYLSWLILVSCRRLRPWHVAFSASMVFYFEAERDRFLTGHWSMPAWVSAAILIIVILFIMADNVAFPGSSRQFGKVENG